MEGVYTPNFAEVGFTDRTTRAYIAGLLDSEGCFQIDKRGVAQVKVETAYPETLQELADLYQRPLKKVGRMSRGGKTMYRVTFSGAKAIMLIQDTLEFLREKKEQATLILKLHSYRRIRPTTYGLKSMDRSYFQRMYARARQLKNINFELSDECENQNQNQDPSL